MSTEDIEVRLQIVEGNVATLISNRNAAFSTFNALSLTYGLNVGTGSTDFDTYALSVGRDAFFAENVYIDGSLDLSSNLDISGSLRIGTDLFVLGGGSISGILDVSNDITGHSNLIIGENATISGNTFLNGDVSLGNDLLVLGNSVVEKDQTIQGTLNVNENLFLNGNLEISGELFAFSDIKLYTLNVETFANISGDVFMGSNLHVVGDVSMESSLEVSENLIVHGNTTLEENTLLKSSFHVIGDVSMESSLEVSENIIVHGNTTLKNNVSLGANLNVSGDVSMENDLNVYNNLDVSNNINVGNKLNVVGDVSMESSLDVQEDLNVHQNLFVDNNVAINSNLVVLGDVSFHSSVEIYKDLIVHDLSIFKENVLIGDTTNNLEDTSFNVYASSNGGDGFVYDGNMIIGIPNSTHDEVINNNRNLTVYGDLRVMDGGNIIIEDISNTTITQLETEVKITDILNVSNDGTGSALTVNQVNTLYHDIVEFQDNSVNVFTIGKDGATKIYGPLQLFNTLNVLDNINIDSSNVDISQNLTVEKESLFIGNTHFQNDVTISGDILIDGKMIANDSINLNNTVNIEGETVIGGDVSMHSSLDISENLNVYGNTELKSSLYVEGDVSFNSSLDISGALTIHNQTKLYGDVYIDSQLEVVDDVSLNSTLSVNGNITTYSSLYVNEKTYLSKDVSMGSALFISGDVSMESSLNINNNLNVENNTVLKGDVSLGSNLNIEGDVYVDSSIDVKESLNIQQDASLNGDVFMGSKLKVFGDVSMESSLYVNRDILIKEESLFIGDVSMNSNLDLSGDATIKSSVDIYKNLNVGNHTNLSNDVSMGSNLDIVGNINTESSINIEQQLNVHGKAFIADDVSMNSQLFIQGDVSMNSKLFVQGDVSFISSLDIQKSLHVQEKTFLNGDVCLNNNLFIYGDVSMLSSLDVSHVNIKNNLFVEKDVSINENVQIDGNVNINNDLNVYRIGINTDPIYSFHIEASDAILLPKGTTAQRPEITTPGLIRYNTETLKFEGYTNNSWLKLGGVIDIDQDTRIEAEQNSDDDTLRFFTSGIEHMLIDSSGDISMTGKLHVANDVSFSSSLEISNNLIVKNNTIMNKNLTLNEDLSVNSQLYVNGDVSFNSKLFVQDSLETSLIGIQTNTPDYSLHVETNDAILIPAGETYERPVVLRDGLIRYNTTDNIFEGYSNNTWHDLANSQSIYDLSVNDLNVLGNFKTSGTFSVGALNIGVGVNDPSYSAHFATSDALLIPVGNTSQRPFDLTPGLIRYNTDLNVFEGYYNDEWKEIGGTTDISGIDTSDINLTVVETTINTLQGDLSLNNVSINQLSSTSLNVDTNVGIGTNTPVVALDIATTDSIKIPVGTTSERPDVDDVGQVRYNSSTSLYEVYTNQTVWSGLPIYKTDQPPFLLNIYQTQSSESVTVSWTKFNETYKDVFDGKSYPIYLQTFVDISFTDINNSSTIGWKTLYIGNGNYDLNGDTTTPLDSLTFDSINGNSYLNTTSYDIDFDNKQSTIDLPSFTQNDSFDLRVYAINKSESLPNYIYIYNVALKQTGEPGPVTVDNTTDFSITQFNMDFSFDLDKNDSTITSGISIVHYDISFNISDSKSLESISHNDNFFIDWENNSSLSKTDIVLSGLYPGAQYDIQVRAQNALNVDSSGDYTYGEYGEIFTSSGFTNSSGNINGLTTTQYVDTSFLNDVDSNIMTFTLMNSDSIQCNISGTNSLASRTILNSNGYIDIANTTEFFLNYGLQGINTQSSSDLVQFTIHIVGNLDITSTLIYDGLTDNQEYAYVGQNIALYKFQSSGVYTDKGKTDNYSKGFVYSSSVVYNSDNLLTENELFFSNFGASINPYELSYEITSQTNNNNEAINNSGDTQISSSTGIFYVDDFTTTPNLSFTTNPFLQVSNSSFLFGIPAVLEVLFNFEILVSNFASYVIPHVNGVHLFTSTLTSSNNIYSFSSFTKTNVYETADYTLSKSVSYSISSNEFENDTNHSYSATVYYLDNSMSTIPSVETYQISATIADIGHIFKDSVVTYTGDTLYSFNGTNSISSSSLIPATDMIDENTLLYFNGKFVSGGYNATYNNSEIIYPFSDWSSGYAVSGQDYSNFTNTGIGGFKWIAIDVTSYKSGNSVVLTNFQINGSSPATDDFGTTYEAYIYQNGKFGSLASAINVSATLWFNSGSNTTIALAKSGEGALQTNGVDAYIDSTSSEDIYLIVGLKQDSDNYFTFS